MALRQSFEAADTFGYRVWDGRSPTYHAYLVTPPRLYDEEVDATDGAGNLGALWTEGEGNAYGGVALKFLSRMNVIDWPGWGTKLWTLDGQHGHALYTERFGTAFSGAGQVYGKFFVESQGQASFLWEFDGHPFIDSDGAVLLDRMTMDVTATKVLPSDFAGHASDTIEDFAISRADNRVFVRWQSDNRGEVRLYRWDTKALVATLYAPNETAGIVLTHDGFAYVVDEADWLMVYDFDGVFHGGMRNPRAAAYPHGAVYGWDRHYKRLLYLPGTANATDGASTLRAKAFFPQAAERIVTLPIPREVPRAGRRTTFLVRVTGDGGEPMAGRYLLQDTSGAASSTRATDSDGNALLEHTPSTTSAVTLTATLTTSF